MKRLSKLLKYPALKHSRFSKINLAVFILIFAGIGGYILLSSHAASSTANVFISSNGSDSGSNCKRFAAAQTNPDPGGTTLCASFNKAYQLASPGDMVEVEVGSYPSQLIPYTSAKPNSYHCDWAANNNIYNPVSDYSGCITFQPASGATVNLGGFSSEAPYVKLEGGASQSFRFDKNDPNANYKFDYCELVGGAGGAASEAPLSISLNGTVTAGSNVITGLSSTAGIIAGRTVTMTSGSELQLPPNTRVVSIDSLTQVTISKNAAQSASGTLKFDTGQVSLTGSITSGSPVITGLASTQYLAPNQTVSGSGILAGSRIASVDSANQITLTQSATISSSVNFIVNTGCYYGSAGIGAGIRTNSYTCYGLTGKPQAQWHDIVVDNVWSNTPFGLSGVHNAIMNSTFDIGDSWAPDGGSSHMEGCRDSTLGATAPGDFLELNHVSIKNVLLTHAANKCDLSPAPPCPSGWMSYHVAPLHWEGGTNSRVVRSLFENNGAHNIELEPEDGYPTADNLLMENNIFGALCADQPAAPSGYCADQGGAQITDCHSTGGTVSNVVYRFNTDIGSSQNSFSRDNSNCTWGGQLIDYANLNTDSVPDASSFACTNQVNQPGVSWDHNLWASGGSAPCGTNSKIGNPAPVRQTYPVDAHLLASSAAIDAVPPGGTGFTACPAMDYYGNSRPQGSACDIGADEFVATTNVWLSTAGNDSTCVRGDQSKPCASFLKAYQIAQCGDTVLVSDGSYGGQTLGHATTGQNTDAKDCSANNNPVIFQGESQSGVIVNGTINIGEPWLTINNVTATGLYVNGYDSTIGCYTNPVQHVLVTNTNVEGKGAVSNPMGMENVQFVTLSNDSIGNVTSGETEIHNGSSSCAVMNNHITITGTTFHDFINVNNGATHMECLQIDMGASGSSNSFFSVTGNKFLNCGQYDIFTSGPQHDMTYQNNWFDDPCSNQGSGCSSLSATSMGPNPDGSGNFYNIVVTFNSYKSDAQWPTATLTGTITGNIIAYNIFPISALDGLTSRCGSKMNATRIDNYVNGNVTCPGDVKTAVTYVAPGPPDYNYNLAVSTAGIDALSPCPAGAPAVDIHGNSRPQGSACDVGAAEYVSGTVNPPPALIGDINGDDKVSLADLAILLTHYGQTANSSQGDLNSDGKVTLADLAILLTNYGR